MAKYTAPITKENYLECWTYVWKKYGQAKRSFLIGKLVGVLGELTFLFGMLFITVGGLSMLKIPVINDFLKAIPHLLPAWKEYTQFVFKPQMETPVRVVLAFLSVYAAAIAVCVALTALVYILYHPIAKKPAEDIQRNADTMAEKARKAKELSIRSKDNIATTCDILYLVLIALLFTAVIILNLDKTNAMEQISGVIPINNMLIVVVAVFAIFFCYSVMDNLFAQIVKWLFFCKVPHSLLADTAYFRLFAGENTEGLTEEEVTAKHLEEAKGKREKALELERSGEYARAKQQFLEAALAGDAVAMDNYARHCIIVRHNEEAIYWLQRCVDTGEADDVTKQRLKDMKRGRHITVKYH